MALEADDSSPYFGYSDARQQPESELIATFYEPGNSILHTLKLSGKKRGICIVVAPKGAGKTEIRRIVQHRSQSSGDAVWVLDGDLTRKINQPDKRGPADIKREVSGLLLSGITARLLADAGFATKVKKQWREKGKELLVRLGAVPKGVGAGGVTIDVDLGALFRDTKPKFEAAPVDDYAAVLRDLLSRKRAFILIDDVDEIFEDAYANPAIVEGVLRSVVDLNLRLGDRVHFLVFLKAGLYETYYEQAKAPNEIRDWVDFIRWSPDDLVSLLAHRIRIRRSLPEERNPLELWRLEFEGSVTTVRHIQDYMTERCNYGPRDLIMLANSAKRLAVGRKINMEHIEAAEPEYCQEKLQLLVGDFGQKYQDVDKLIRRAFTGQKAEYLPEALQTFVRTEIIQNKDFADQLPFRRYIKFTQEDKLIKLLFEMGFIGYRTSEGDRHDYSITSSFPGEVEGAITSYKIHLAYSKCLRLK